MFNNMQLQWYYKMYAKEEQGTERIPVKYQTYSQKCMRTLYL